MRLHLYSLFGLAAVSTLCSASASAQVWLDVNQIDGSLPKWADERYVRPATTSRAPAIPPDDNGRFRRVWVEPVYEVVRKRVWAEPVTRFVYEQVWCPPRYEIHETVCWEGSVQVIRRERVCMEPGGYKCVRRPIVERTGCWTWIETRDLVRGGFWKLEPL